MPKTCIRSPIFVYLPKQSKQMGMVLTIIFWVCVVLMVLHAFDIINDGGYMDIAVSVVVIGVIWKLFVWLF